MDINSLLCTKTDCPCGSVHSCEIERVIIEKGAISRISDLDICGKYQSILVVCDKNTERAAGERVISTLGESVKDVLVYDCDGFLVPNEKSIETLSERVTEKIQLIVGVGSGVINDLCKYVSFEKGLPYYIVATAPSMDGYASKGAAMIIGGMKVTYNTHVPKCIIGDTDVLSKAPIEMIKSGYGDIIGKFSCLNDWKLSSVVNGERVCEYIYKLTYDTTLEVSRMAKEILSRSDEAVEKLMKALVVVGIAMAYMGNSRPASGSEHHLSHYFEIVGLLEKKPYFCHGIDVAYSAYAVQLMREEILKISSPKMKEFCRKEWESSIRRVYTDCADGVISLQERLGWIYEDKSSVYTEKWEEIRTVLAEVPSSCELLQMLTDIDLPLKDFFEMYGTTKIYDGFLYAKELKDRYTVLWLFSSLDGIDIKL